MKVKKFSTKLSCKYFLERENFQNLKVMKVKKFQLPKPKSENFQGNLRLQKSKCKV